MESTFIILTQIITFGTAWSMFHCVLKRKKKDWFSLVGALGYLLLPYHVYVVTESVDRSQILIWMVVPILAASLVKMSDTEKMFWKTGYGLTAVLALGIIGNLAGFAWFDPLAALAVGLLIARMGYRFAVSALHDLMDRAVDEEMQQAIADTLRTTPGVAGLHDLKTRKAGDLVLVDVHLEVAGEMSVAEGHQIARHARERVLAQHPVLNVMVHLDPCEAQGLTKVV
jgi:cation diffusion facilitator family transporter